MDINLIGDFISMDNGNDYLMVRKEKVLSVHIFPPNNNGICSTDKWRVQVSGEGYIVFDTDTRDEAIELVNMISNLLK